jgi:sulfur carrier protein
MRIFLNDDAHDIEPGTLAAALESLGFAGRKIATAVNGRFVAAAARARTALAEGDRVEVVAPMQGG